MEKELEEVKKIINTVAIQAVMLCPDTPNEDYYARQICQLIDAECQQRVEKIFKDIEEQAKYNTSVLTQLDFFQSPFWQALKKREVIDG